ncbi:MAG: flagellar filament capping protein FliD [Lysobacteraceae bacterium]
MATITSAGLGSGLDVSSLVSQLVAAERAPAENRLNRIASLASAQLSSLGTISGVLSSLRSSAQGFIGSTGAFGARTTSVSATGFFSASASATAQAGAYSVEVKALATASKLASAPQLDAETLIGDGDLTLTVGADSFTVNLTTTTGTLEGIRDAINEATDNAGVTATLVTADDGVRLILTGRETGAANAVSVTGSTPALSAFATGLTTTTPAADAEIEVDGFAVTRDSNSISDVIEGVTLNLSKAEIGTLTTLTVARDDNAAVTQVQGLVTAVNLVFSTIKSATKYDPDTQTASILTGDAMARSVQTQLRSTLTGTVSGASAEFDMLNDLGITFQADGTLKLDATVLREKLADDPAAVQRAFSGTDGFASKLVTLADGFIGGSGSLSSRTSALNDRLASVSDQREALDLRMSAIETRYLKQFTALDTLISQLQSTSSFLTSQLANLPGAYSGE